MSTLDALDRIDVRIPLEAGDDLAPEPFLAVFGRWRTDEDRVERDALVDLADYAHLPLGPRALLVSHRFQLAVDWAEDGPGLLLSVRQGLEGDLAARVAGALEQARARGAELLGQPEVPADLALAADRVTVTLNDRSLAPNTEATDALARPAIAEALDGWALEWERGERGRYRVRGTHRAPLTPA